MITRRAMLGGTIIAAWLAGLAVLVQREYFRPRTEQLAQAAARVTPGAVFFAVMQNDEQVGFASTTIDTAQASISVVDYLAADVQRGGKIRRETARTNVVLSRALRVRTFEISLNAGGPPRQAGGRVDGDSVLVVGIESGTEKADSQRVALTGPILLPTLVPFAVALSERPKVGKRVVLPILDPSSMSPKDVTFHVLAESVFVLNDSAAFDSTTKRWHGVKQDTVRAWNLSADETAGGAGFSGWVDEQGRVVQTTQLGFVLKRRPYEVAFENWRADSGRVATLDDRDVSQNSLIASNKRIDHRTDSLVVRVSGVNLARLGLQDANHHLSGNTLTIVPVPESALNARYRLPMTRRITATSAATQGDEKRFSALGVLAAKGSRDPHVVAESLTTAVHKSLRPRATFGAESAVQTLNARAGDCNEYTELFVAIARSIGLSTRVATGIAYVDGKFYYHAWPEVFLTDWVAVDPTFGQFPADAAHIRLAVGEGIREADVQSIIPNLKIDVIAVNGKPMSPAMNKSK
ncbi:MAG: transglutaminase-like domain-containing protein [Gemmatimonadaceae bacterium]